MEKMPQSTASAIPFSRIRMPEKNDLKIIAYFREVTFNLL
jgi:hypothetical protein